VRGFLCLLSVRCWPKIAPDLGFMSVSFGES
jgi:hypothetical protein